MTAVAAVSAGFVAGFAVSDAQDDGGPTAYLPAVAGLDGGWSCDRLLQWYVDHGVRRVTAWGWQSPIYNLAGPMADGAVVSATPSTRVPAAAPLDTQTGSDTGTNVQEAGVDEPDIVKVSGDLLVSIHDGVLETYDVGGDQPERLGSTLLRGIGDPQLLLAGDRAVVVGSAVDDPAAGATLGTATQHTVVRTFDLSDPAHPSLVGSRSYAGSTVIARQTGTVVRLVLDSGLPDLPFVTPSSTMTRRQALEHNRHVVRDSSASDWLPQVTSYSGTTESTHTVVDCADVSVPSRFQGLGTLTVVGFDPAAPGDTDVTAVTTGSDSAYMSTDHLYVAMGRWSDEWGGFRPMTWTGPGPTRIYAFDLGGMSSRYAGMGVVDGSVGGSWSMDEKDGVLRVAVVGSTTDGSSTSIVTLRPEGGRLVEVGKLDGLGVSQELKSVRWFDDLAVLVTFRQTDPFYVVDLADPADPHVLGELHLPGWSSYLHPVGSDLILGLGQTAARRIIIDSPVPQDRPTAPSSPGSATVRPLPSSWVQPIWAPRGKATLFDISDLAHPTDVDTVTYPVNSVPMAGTDPHQVTWLPDSRTLLTVLGSSPSSGFDPDASSSGEQRTWLSILTIGDDGMQSRLVPVSTWRTDEVRTVPTGDGRVVLVAGDSVEFVAV